MMKFSALMLMGAALLAASPLMAAPKSAPKPSASVGAPGAEGDEAAAPKTGVRFVICAPDGATLPSPLYYKSGKTTYKSVTIGSRTPTPRIRPEAGFIHFYGEDPSAAVAAAAAEKKEVELPKPVLSVPVEGTGRQLCIVIPSKASDKPLTFSVKESAFPKNGMHIINFSSFPLRVSTSVKGDFSDKKEEKVGVFHRDKGICDDNTWQLKGEPGQAISFMLEYKTKDAKDYKRAKASKFVISDRQAQISVVVKDPSRDMIKLLSIQLPEDK